MSLRLFFPICCFLFAGCFGDNEPYSYNPQPRPGNSLYTPATPPPSISECAPDDDAWQRARRLYEDTEWSIHELITCGQVQVRLAKSLLAIVLASNEEIFRRDTFEQVSEFANMVGLDLQAPFERAEDGRWSMPIPTAGPGSRFWVEFFKRGNEEPILADPFDLDSYLTGVHVETSHTLDEMLDDFDERNLFTFHWETEGPLVGLLNGGEPVPNPFEVNVSILDIASLVFPSLAVDGAEFGPLVSLVDAEMMSCVELADERGGTRVEYRADGRRDTVGNIAGSSKVSFDIERITATNGALELVGDASNLRYLGVKTLAGAIFYELTGPGITLEIVSDFREGNAWPVTEWLCSADALEQP